MGDDEVLLVISEYKVYGIRWIQLLVFFFATLSNGIHSMTFAPIANQTSEFYQISTSEVNALAVVFLFLYVVGTILSIWLSRKFSLRVVIIIGSVLNLGVFIRPLALINRYEGYAPLLIGQLFPAVAGPFFLNSTALIAARWFAPSQRDVATAIGSMANPLGIAIGSLLPSLIIDSDRPTSNQFLILLLAEGGLTLLSTILIIIVFRSDPPTPPSPSEEHHQSIHLKEDFIQLMKNRHYLILLFGFSLGLAAFNSLTTLLAQLIAPTGYSSDQAGILGATVIVAGLLNAFIVGIIMDKTHAYRLILKVLLLGACGAGIFFVFALRPDRFVPLTISIGLMGFFLLPLLPVSFECAVECTYPIRAEWSTGFLLCTGNILGGIFIFVLQYLIKLNPTYKSDQMITPSSIFLLCLFLVSAVALFLFRGPYLRLEAEKVEQTDDTATVNT